VSWQPSKNSKLDNERHMVQAYAYLCRVMMSSVNSANSAKFGLDFRV